MAHRFDDISLDELRRRNSVKWRTAPPDALPSFVAEMDFPAADPIRRRLHEAVDRSDFGYTPFDTGPLVGEALGGYAADAWGWSVDPGHVIVLGDVMRGLELCVDTFTAPGDGIVVNTPVYPPFLHTVHDSDRTLVESPVVWRDGRPCLDLAGLADAFAGATAYLLCNPHNPTGLVPTADELTEILRLAERHGVLVVSDEVHGPLTYPDATFTPILALPNAGRVAVAVTSASKAWNIPGLKTAALVVPGEDRRKALLDLSVRTRMGASILGVHANVAAWTAGREWLAEVLEYLDGNRHHLAALLAEHVPGIRYAVPDATYLAWLDCRGLGLDDPAATLLERGDIALSDGATFGPPGRGWLRLNFATSRPLLEEQVRRITRALSPPATDHGA